MRQNGFTLIVSLIFLVLMTMLGLAMFSGFNLNETMAGNLREKSRAFDAAQTALNFAEYWISQPGNALTGAGTPIQGTACSTSSMTSTPTVCNNALANSTTVPWAAGVNYTPSGMTVNAGGGSGTYSANPTYYIQYLGPPLSGGGGLFQVTTAGQGGNANSVAVLQSVYQVTCQICNLGGS